MMGGVSADGGAGERRDPVAARRAWERFAERHGGVVSTSDIAERFGVSRQRARTMVRAESFPEPVVRLGGSDVWLVAEVDAWRAPRGKRGRPSFAALDDA